MRKRCENHTDYHYQQQLLIKSPENRNIDIVIVSSHEGKNGNEEIQNDNILQSGGIARFQHWKPVILISARVHPI
jgi:hypothetical protein